MKLVTKILVLVVVLALALCAAPAAFAAAGDSAAEPIVLTAIPSEPIVIPVHQTVWYSIPAGGKQLDLSVTGANATIYSTADDGFGGYEILANIWNSESGSVPFVGTEEGAPVIIGISAAGRSGSASITMTLSDLVKGIEANPDNAADYYFSGTGSYVLNKDLEAGNEFGYWWTFTVPETANNNIISVKTSPKPGFEEVPYTLSVEYLLGDIPMDTTSADGNPITTYKLPAGTVVTINLVAEYDWDTGTCPELGAYVEMILCEGTNDDPVRILNRDQSTGVIIAEPFNAYVNAGASITFIDGNSFANTWTERGVKITTKGFDDDMNFVHDVAAIAETTVIMNGVAYHDNDGDGYIELMIEPNSDGMNAIAIVNNNDANKKYSVEFVDEAEESDCIHADVSAYEYLKPCHYEGQMAHWYCNNCDSYFSDAALTSEITEADTILPAVSTLNHNPAKEPCHTDGWIEHWTCDTCQGVWTNAQGTGPMANMMTVKLPADEELIHVEKKDAECHEPGNIEYWYCATCGGHYTHADGTGVTNAKSVLTPAETTMQYTAAVEVGCHQNGMKEHWYCAECDVYFTDAAGKQPIAYRSLTIPYAADNVEHVEASNGGCHQHSIAEYWHCTKCDAVFSDAALTKLTNIKNLTTPYNAENIKHVAAVAATEKANGNHEYWICDNCKAVFTDAALTKISNIKNVTIPATGNPKTGDMGITLAAVVAMVSMGAILVIGKKKEF